jgi:glutamine amidotransferase
VSPKITIVDYGAGNLRSVARAVARAGYEATVSGRADDVDSADALIVPGVGAAADTMRNLRERGLVEPVRRYIEQQRPFLGVCMGLQALLSVSEEGGEHECLGVVPGRVLRLPPGLKVPHMGWNRVRQKADHPVFRGVADGSYFYFVHSYYPQPDDPSVVIGETEYGVTFPSVVALDSLVATQFHPEKSGEAGLRIYANFLSRALGGGQEA